MKNIVGLVKRAFFKLFIGPLRYGRQNDYNAAKYWQDRFSKYGNSIQGPGNEALSETANEKMYSEAKTTFLKACEKEGIDFSNSKICEIGLGTGFYTEILSDLKVKSYHGFDIADVLIPQLKSRFPSFNFEKKDISTHPLGSTFDVTIIIDVVQHIVNIDKFSFAIKNITDHLSPGGTLVIGPLGNKSFKKLFYVHSWTISDIKNIIGGGFKISEPVQFRNGQLYIIKKL